ncbi:hypothetical protein DESUT3_01870 [Desulfuromonas versatilis]|uniref:histidine kinase n=1 Tax=Desulfuromonas versatilis TaxID=2802975 RepID=A0ABN6DSE9_9BACT|nr:ATP-binding protein [Desulfuromonas versatilis]BCR03118.1 hypothetical protein DESUT3_01870 [Desulfuromonas versatilis]
MNSTGNELYRVIFETTNSALAVLEDDLTLALVNPEFETLFGVPKAQTEGRRKLLDFVADIDRPRVAEYQQACLAGEGLAPQTYEAQMQDIAGNVRHVLISAARIDGASRSVISISDISGRKDVETRLAKSQVQLFQQHDKLNRLFQQVAAIKNEAERTMDCIGDWLVLLDDAGRIRRCNNAFREFIGRDFQELKGSPLADHLAELQIGLRLEGSQSLEVCHEVNGRWLALDTYPFIDEKGQVNGAVLTARDITETKQINNQLHEANQELENAYAELQATQSRVVQQEKLATIGQLAAGIAHEINNPMGFITSNLTTLQKYVERLTQVLKAQHSVIRENQVTAESRQMLEELESSSKLGFILEDVPALLEESLEGASRVAKIVQDFRTFSRVDSAEKTLADINHCLDSTINMVWNELKFKAELVKEYGEVSPVLCHPNRLNQVFMNLLVNAGQAIERKGTIRIRTWQEPGEVLVSVADTGCGIPPENLDRLFEPFFTTKEAGKGTGLGLSITCDIIKDHGGEITVASQPGEGTTFTIRLPVVQNPHQLA